LKKLFTAAAATTVACGALAQVGTGFSISDGDVFFDQGNSPTVSTGAGATGANFRVNGGGGLDHMFQNWFWYRTDLDTREHAFNNSSGTVAGANTATTNFTFSTFSSSVEYTVTDLGIDSGMLRIRNTVTNTGSTTQDINIFNYLDMDVAQTAANDSANGGLAAITITDGLWQSVFTGVGADEYQVTTFATLRTQLSNVTVEDFNNTGLPFGPGDFTGGYQWRLDLAPQALFVVESVVTVTMVPEPGTFIAVGAGAVLLLLRRRR
jgi:hypothetical protein